MEGHWKFLGGGGVLKVKILEAKYEAKLEFPGIRGGGGGGGGGCKTKKPSEGVLSMHIFWYCTFTLIASTYQQTKNYFFNGCVL